MSTTLLHTENLVCHRGGRALFAPVNVTLGEGTLLVLRGPNGSGKTSLLRALAGLLPCDGKIEKLAACYIGHKPALHDRLTAREHLVFWQNIARNPLHFSDTDILEAFGLSTLANQRAGTFSQGQRQRLSLCRLLIEKAPLWLLDEPASALDEAGTTLLTALLKAHADAGGAAVVASHHENFEGASLLALGAA